MICGHLYGTILIIFIEDLKQNSSTSVLDLQIELTLMNIHFVSRQSRMEIDLTILYDINDSDIVDLSV